LHAAKVLGVARDRGDEAGVDLLTIILEHPHVADGVDLHAARFRGCLAQGLARADLDAAIERARNLVRHATILVRRMPSAMGAGRNRQRGVSGIATRAARVWVLRRSLSSP